MFNGFFSLFITFLDHALDFISNIGQTLKLDPFATITVL